MPENNKFRTSTKKLFIPFNFQENFIQSLVYFRRNNKLIIDKRINYGHQNSFQSNCYERAYRELPIIEQQKHYKSNSN